jgi:hypothetical protein
MKFTLGIIVVIGPETDNKKEKRDNKNIFTLKMKIIPYWKFIVIT